MYQNYTLEDVKKSAERKLFTVFSTFAGGGGSSTGYKLAGGDVRGVLEFQKVGIRTYLQNYPKTKFFCKDIRNVTGQQVLDRLRMQPEELDIFDGSPPCPPFSMSGSKRKGWNKTKTVYGKKQTNIEDLSFDMARLVGVVRPKIVIYENVKGLTMEYAADHFKKIVSAFEEHGYQSVNRVLNANDYGVPQGRERVFVIGVRDDILPHGLALNWAFPTPIDNRPNMRDAIWDLRNDDENLVEHEELMGEMKKQKRWKYLSKMPLDDGTDDGKLPDDKFAQMDMTIKDEMEREYDEEVAKDSTFADENLLYHYVHKNPSNKESDRKEDRYNWHLYWEDKDYSPEKWENKSYVRPKGFQVRRVPWDKPSHTLTERGLQIGTCAHLHPGEHRGFTPLEARRIMSLPSDYHLDGTTNEKLARIGLMVAPLQMKALAENVYNQYLRG